MCVVLIIINITIMLHWYCIYLFIYLFIYYAKSYSKYNPQKTTITTSSVKLVKLYILLFNAEIMSSYKRL